MVPKVWRMAMRRFIDLVVRGRRLVGRAPERGGTLTQFSFRLAFMVDIAYVGMGALGGVAVGRIPFAPAVAGQLPARSCRADAARQGTVRWILPNVNDAARPGGASDM